MKRIEFQQLLEQYPEDMPIKILIDHATREVFEMTEENIMHTSDTAWYREAEEEDEEDELGLGDGQQYLLINPIIV